jgi:HK97 family phage major capsid protein
MSIQALREERTKYAKEYRELLDKNPGSLSASVVAKLDDLESKIEAVDRQIHREERILQSAADTITAGRVPGGSMGAKDAAIALAQYYKTGDTSGFGPRNTWTEAGDGGVVVPHELHEQILLAQQKFSPLRTICRILQTRTAHSNFTVPVATSGAAVGWVGETDTRNLTDTPVLDSVTFPDSEAYVLLPVSAWMESDTMIADFIQTELARAFGRAEGEKFLSGSGTKAPKGILSYTFTAEDDDARDWGKLQYVPSGSTTGIADYGDPLIDLCYSLRAGYRQNAVWLMNSSTLAAVRQLRDSQNRPLWEPGLSGQPQQLLGHRVVEADHMPDIGENNIPILFGDFQCYGILDREMSIQRDPYTVKPLVAFYGKKRVSGALLDSCGIKGLKCAAS